MQTGQLNPLFHTCTDLVNRIGAWQHTDWLVFYINFSFTNTNNQYIWLKNNILHSYILY